MKQTDSNLKPLLLANTAEDEKRDKIHHGMILSAACIPMANHVTVHIAQSEIKKNDIKSSFQTTKKTIATTPSQESLTEKKERLARALKRIALEKAKARLKVAQKKRQETLACVPSRQQKTQTNESICPSSSHTTNRTIDQANTKQTARAVIVHPNSLAHNAVLNLRHVEQRAKLRDITAYDMSHLIIRNIGCSGPLDRIRVIAQNTFSLMSTDEEHVLNDQLSDTDKKISAENESIFVDSRKKVEAASTSYPYLSPSKNLPGTFDQPEVHFSDTQMKTKSINKNLQLLKSRLRLKLLEKARIERKRKFIAQNDKTSPEKYLKKENTVLNLRVVTYDESKEESKTLEDRRTNTEVIEVRNDTVNPLIYSSNNYDTMQVCGITTGGTVLDVETISNKSDRDNIGEETEGLVTKKKFVSLLKERQRILKDNIDTSKINQRELKYNMDISSLNILVNRQRESLAKQGKKVSKNSNLLKECCKELKQDKQSITLSEKRIHELQKRKRIMENMLLTVTRKLIDGRRSRDEFAKLSTRSKRNKSVHPHTDILEHDVNDRNV